MAGVPAAARRLALDKISFIILQKVLSSSKNSFILQKNLILKKMLKMQLEGFCAHCGQIPGIEGEAKGEADCDDKDGKKDDNVNHNDDIS